MYVTWYELIEFIMALITLAFVIMSYLNGKKRYPPLFHKCGYLFYKHEEVTVAGNSYAFMIPHGERFVNTFSEK